MNLDLLYTVSFVLLKGNTLSNTDILKLNFKVKLTQKDNSVAFHMLELHLCYRMHRPPRETCSEPQTHFTRVAH